MKKFTHLVTAGCSFSDNSGQKWPRYLRERLTASLWNRGQQSVGSDYIRRAAEFQCNQLLSLGVAASDILLVVMWSGTDRLSLWVNQEQTASFSALTHPDQNPLDPTQGEANQWWGRSRQDRGWLVGSSNCNFQGQQQAYKTRAITEFYPDEALAIHSREQWLYLQYYCQARGIALINTLWHDELHWPRAWTSAEPLLRTRDRWASCSQLEDQIEWSKWIFWGTTGGQWEFTRDRHLAFEADGVHPGQEANRMWVEEVLWPGLDSR